MLPYSSNTNLLPEKAESLIQFSKMLLGSDYSDHVMIYLGYVVEHQRMPFGYRYEWVTLAK